MTASNNWPGLCLFLPTLISGSINDLIQLPIITVDMAQAIEVGPIGQRKAFFVVAVVDCGIGPGQ